MLSVEVTRFWGWVFPKLSEDTPLLILRHALHKADFHQVKDQGAGGRVEVKGSYRNTVSVCPV